MRLCAAPCAAPVAGARRLGPPVRCGARIGPDRGRPRPSRTARGGRGRRRRSRPFGIGALEAGDRAGAPSAETVTPKKASAGPPEVDEQVAAVAERLDGAPSGSSMTTMASTLSASSLPLPTARMLPSGRMVRLRARSSSPARSRRVDAVGAEASRPSCRRRGSGRRRGRPSPRCPRHGRSRRGCSRRPAAATLVRLGDAGQDDVVGDAAGAERLVEHAVGCVRMSTGLTTPSPSGCSRWRGSGRRPGCRCCGRCRRWRRRRR